MLATDAPVEHRPIIRKDPSHNKFASKIAPRPNSWYLKIKTGGDCFIASALLILFTPVVLIAALLIKLTSKGPAFFTQKRVGRDNRIYTIYKLRTMYHDCEKQSGPQWSRVGDPRVTALGRFLRRSHIDELPQLWNVLKCDMSLVGPRPERPEFVKILAHDLPHYRERLRVRPGMTGLAQVQLPPDTDLASVRRKLTCDLFYVHHISLLLDLKVALGTVFYLAGIPFGWTRTLFQMPTSEAVESVYRGMGAQNARVAQWQTV
ncbi:MAG: sugar transferase [Gemmataceae bacterium]